MGEFTEEKGQKQAKGNRVKSTAILQPISVSIHQHKGRAVWEEHVFT